jgi:hypothetical protein
MATRDFGSKAADSLCPLLTEGSGCAFRCPLLDSDCESGQGIRCVRGLTQPGATTSTLAQRLPEQEWERIRVALAWAA